LAAFDEAGNADEWTFAPFVGAEGGMAVDAFGQFVAVVEGTPAQKLATWIFLKYFTSPKPRPPGSTPAPTTLCARVPMICSKITLLRILSG